MPAPAIDPAAQLPGGGINIDTTNVDAGMGAAGALVRHEPVGRPQSV
jgi:hypothetical protein